MMGRALAVSAIKVLDRVEAQRDTDSVNRPYLEERIAEVSLIDAM